MGMKILKGPVLMVGKKEMTTDLIVEGTWFIVQPSSRLPEGLLRVDISEIEEDLTIIGDIYDLDAYIGLDGSTECSHHNVSLYGPGCPNYPFEES